MCVCVCRYVIRERTRHACLVDLLPPRTKTETRSSGESQTGRREFSFCCFCWMEDETVPRSSQSASTDGPRLLDLPRGGLWKSSCEEGGPLLLRPGSLGRSERTPSASSDSGLSVASQGQRGGAPQDRHTHTGKLLPGSDFEIAPPLLEVMTDLAARGRGDSGPGAAINGGASPRQRETDVLEDERGADAAPASSSVFQNLPGTQAGSWIHAVPPPARGLSSREAVQKGAQKGAQRAPVMTPSTSSDPEEDLTSLTADVDESIEQLNQLILDLDPTFVPVPTRCSPLSRSASLHANNISHEGKTHQSGESEQQKGI